MDVKNNPAGRLHDILSAARQQNAHEPARKAWATVFQIEPNDTGTLLKMVADLIDLVRETKASIQRLEGVNQELHLRPFIKIEALLSQLNLDAGWEHWKNQIDETTLYGLQFSADKLSRISGFTHIPNDELADIRSKIDDLFNTATDSTLPHDLKLLLLRNLDAIRLAFVAYRVRGIEGLQEEIERSVGSVLLRQEEIKASKPEERRVWQSFFTLVEQLNKLVTLARNSKELAAPVMQALTKLLE